MKDDDRLKEARATQEARNKAWREKVGPFWKATNGNCCICGKHLMAYLTKFVNVKDGRIHCREHAQQPDFYEWSDG